MFSGQIVASPLLVIMAIFVSCERANSQALPKASQSTAGGFKGTPAMGVILETQNEPLALQALPPATIPKVRIFIFSPEFSIICLSDLITSTLTSQRLSLFGC